MAVIVRRVDLAGDFQVWIKSAINSGEGKLLSLSARGAYVATTMNLLPHAQVRLAFILPETKRQFELDAVVNWENRGSERKGGFPAGYGFRFTEIPSEAAENIRDILRSAVYPHPDESSATIPRNKSTAGSDS